MVDLGEAYVLYDLLTKSCILGTFYSLGVLTKGELYFFFLLTLSDNMTWAGFTL
jgi:hypothetical protein